MIETPSTLKQEIESAISCWYITGATASGKTEISLALARALGAEVISLDSMAVYRGMNVGTAKPSLAQIREIPHHLINICDPVESFSVSQYRQAALRTIRDIRDRGKSVVFVGGTALYLKALLRGIFAGPPADWDFRQEIEDELQQLTPETLHQRLQQVDPLSAHKLHPNDRRRIIRALEVYKKTGKPISHLQNEFEIGHPSDDCRVFTLRHPRERLHQRIQERVRRMFAQDFVGEVRGLLDKWQNLSHTASQAVGYREVIEYLQGQRDLQETQDRVLYRTRQFARHQETWFRGLSECRICDLPEQVDVPALVEQILTAGQKVVSHDN